MSLPAILRPVREPERIKEFDGYESDGYESDGCELVSETMEEVIAKIDRYTIVIQDVMKQKNAFSAEWMKACDQKAQESLPENVEDCERARRHYYRLYKEANEELSKFQNLRELAQVKLNRLIA